MFCPNCGINADQSVQCFYCGALIPPKPRDEEEKKPRRKRKRDAERP